MQRLGSGLSQEIVLILFAILQRKMGGFRDLMEVKQNDWLIPKFDRFWSDGETDKEAEG